MVKIEDAFTNEEAENTELQNKRAGKSGSNLSISGATTLSRTGENSSSQKALMRVSTLF